jgi:signal transduction histidine kinase
MAEEMVKEFDDGADPNRYRTLEIEYICRDGRRLICELKSKALRDIHGMPIGVQTTGRDITERKRMAQALERSRDELRSLTQRLTTVVEAERQRIARELHDQMGQNLAVLGVTLKTIQALLPQEMPVDVRLHCEMIAQLIREMGNRLREVILDLRPPILDEYGLLPTLQWAVQQLRQQTGITVEFMTLGEPVPLAADFELAMFRIMQEAIANILKHARATTIFITLEFARDATCLTIADDGIGFDIDALAEGTVLESIHLGLLTMQERAGNIGASCRIDSHPDAGTRVIVTLPGGKHGD